MAEILTAPFLYPPSMRVNDGSQALLSFGAINASGDRVAWVVRAPKAGTLHSFEFRIQTVTNNPDNGLRLSFQNVSATTGAPDTTQDQFRDLTEGGTITTGWKIPPGALTSDGTDNGTKRTVTKGELVACVVDFVNFTASDSVTITAGLNSSAATAVDDSGLYAKDGSGGNYNAAPTRVNLVLALKYDDGTYAEFPVWAPPIVSIADTSFASNSTPDERGVVFTAPAPFIVSGAWLRMTTSGDFVVKLYDDEDNEVATSPTMDANQFGDSPSPTQTNVHVLFTANALLTKDATYRLTLIPSTTTAVTLSEITVNAAAQLAAMPGGASWMLTTRADAGSFSNTNTVRPVMGLIVVGVNTGSDGGGNSGGAPVYSYEG